MNYHKFILKHSPVCLLLRTNLNIFFLGNFLEYLQIKIYACSIVFLEQPEVCFFNFYKLNKTILISLFFKTILNKLVYNTICYTYDMFTKIKTTYLSTGCNLKLLCQNQFIGIFMFYIKILRDKSPLKIITFFKATP